MIGLSVSYRRRGRVYHARYLDPRSGRWHERSTRATTLTGARTVFEAIAPRLLSLAGAAARVALADLAAEFLHEVERRIDRTNADAATRANFASRARKLRQAIMLFGPTTPLGALTPATIRERLEDFAATRSAGTAHKVLVELRRFTRWMTERGDLTVDPTASITIRVPLKKRDRSLEPEDVQRLLDAAPDRRRIYLRGLIELGCRPGREIESIRWADVDLARRLVRVRGRKTALADRQQPIRASFAELLAEHRAGAPDDALAFGRWSNARREFSAIRTRAGLPDVRLTDLRHAYASWSVQAGVPLAIVAAALGHRSTRMVEAVYGHLRPGHLGAVLDALPEFAT
jgi:integrase